MVLTVAKVWADCAQPLLTAGLEILQSLALVFRWHPCFAAAVTCDANAASNRSPCQRATAVRAGCGSHRSRGPGERWTLHTFHGRPAAIRLADLLRGPLAGVVFSRAPDFWVGECRGSPALPFEAGRVEPSHFCRWRVGDALMWVRFGPSLSRVRVAQSVRSLLLFASLLPLAEEEIERATYLWKASWNLFRTECKGARSIYVRVPLVSAEPTNTPRPPCVAVKCAACALLSFL